MSEAATRPFVSVIMPVRGDAGWIARAIRSVLDQDYPADRMEVLVVVGGGPGSATHAAVRELEQEDGRVRLLESPSGRTPTSLNIGLRAARGSVIARVDGHAWIEPTYLRRGVEALAETAADAVGGRATFRGEGPFGRAIAVAMQSRLGAGTATFRVGTEQGETDTLMWGLYPRETFERVGEWDEALLRNQDDEHFHRIRLAGGSVVFVPTMRFSHVVRSSLSALWSQYQQWGRFRVDTLRKHRRPGAIRQLAPPALVAALTLSSMFEAASKGRWPVGRAAVGAYAAGATTGGLIVGLRNEELRIAARVPLAIITMHLAYGCGFWAGVLDAGAGRRG